MRVFCPNCGTENDVTAGGRVTCRACTATFDAPAETGAAAQPAAPQPPIVPAGLRATPAPVQHQSPPQQPVAVQPPPNVWAPQPQSFGPPPTASGPTNPLAIISLVSSIIGCLCMPALGSIVGIITGVIALSQVNQAQGAQRGRELAIAGIAVSLLGCLGWMGYFVLAIIGSR